MGRVGTAREVSVGRLRYAAIVDDELCPLRVAIPFRCETILEMLPGGCVVGQGSLQ
jgi:hypothetical protein